LITLCAAVAGCGGDSDASSDATGQLPSCAKPAKTIARPKALPAELPVPRGTVFTKKEKPFPEQHVVSGVSPGDLDSVRSFYGDSLEDAGYSEGPGESEPGETEALFSGRGVRGGWRANELPECDGAVGLTLVIVRG
jgi:hypothetical protein